jgi:hypothetical protein
MDKTYEHHRENDSPRVAATPADTQDAVVSRMTERMPAVWSAMATGRPLPADETSGFVAGVLLAVSDSQRPDLVRNVRDKREADAICNTLVRAIATKRSTHAGSSSDREVCLAVKDEHASQVERLNALVRSSNDQRIGREYPVVALVNRQPGSPAVRDAVFLGHHTMASHLALADDNAALVPTVVPSRDFAVLVNARPAYEIPLGNAPNRSNQTAALAEAVTSNPGLVYERALAVIHSIPGNEGGDP